MKKKLMALTTLAVTLGAAMSANAATEVSLWHYFDQEADAKAIVEWCEEYNGLQEDIHITPTFVARQELLNQYTIGAISGELPDIGMVDSPDMASFIALGVFEDITTQLEAWGELDKIYPGPLASCTGSDGKLYGLPQNTNCLTLACNMDLLAAAGYDHMPTCLEEFKEMVAATTDAENGVYGYAMCCISTEEGTFQILPWLRSSANGQEGVNVDNLTADTAVAGLTVLGDFVANGYMSKEAVNWTQADAFNQFAAGKAAFAEIGTWHLAQTGNIAGFEYDFCLLPTGDEGTSTSTIGGENFGVCTGAENVDACVDFLTWMMSQEKAAEWAVTAGKLPIRSDATPEYTYEQEGFALFTEQMQYAQARGPHAEWPVIGEAIYKAAQSVFVDGVAPADALATAAATIAPIVEANPIP